MPGGRPAHFPGDLRVALMEAAEAELAASGVSGLSLRAVARRVGVSHAAPAHHFRDRAGLLTALATRGATILTARLEAAAAPAADPGGRLEALGLAYVAFARDHPALFDVMLRPDLVHGDDADLVAAEAAAYGALTRTVAEAVAGGWGAGCDPDVLAVLAWSTVHGLAVLERDGQFTGRHPTPERLAGDVAAALARLGALPAPPGGGPGPRRGRQPGRTSASAVPRVRST
jgi:AcrR family transcriptional regulator